MCLTCGCGLPYESHGDPRNITVDDIKEATSTLAAKGESADEAIINLKKTWPKAKAMDKSYRARKDQSDMIAKDFSGMIGKAIKK